MFGVGPVVTVFMVLCMSLVVIRMATVGLALTGISKDLAQFQALSAFTGSGFTTRESEEIVNHPVRRRIVMHLMLLGNAGIIIAISSVMLSFTKTDPTDPDWFDKPVVRMLIMVFGVVVLMILASSRHIERLMWNVNTWALRRWGHLDVQDYTKLLRLARDYVIWELQIKGEDWMTGRSLAEMQLASEGVLVLGIERRDGGYVGAPRGITTIEAGDSLIIYGRQETLVDLDARSAGMVGNLHHVMAVTRQMDVIEKERETEPT